MASSIEIKVDPLVGTPEEPLLKTPVEDNPNSCLETNMFLVFHTLVVIILISARFCSYSPEPDPGRCEINHILDLIFIGILTTILLIAIIIYLSKSKKARKRYIKTSKRGYYSIFLTILTVVAHLTRKNGCDPVLPPTAFQGMIDDWGTS